MTFAGFVEIITAFFKFPDAILRMVQLFKKTPQEWHEDILKKMEDEATNFEKTGRPTWR